MIWEKLIYHWCNEKGRYGLTIPFLIGAERLSRELTIESLLTEIKESNSKFLISSCGDLNEYVIGTHKHEYAYINSLKNFGSLIINDNKLEKIKTMEELIKKMENEYLEKTENKLYSKNYYSGEWTTFEDNDIELIKNLD